MLTNDQIIAHMLDEGITFDRCSVDQAREFLDNKTYYLKISTYKRLFGRRSDGAPRDGSAWGGGADGRPDTYTNLDFAYLKDLSGIDQQMRYSILPMTLDVEHFAKSRLMHVIEAREDEDGYRIVDSFREAQRKEGHGDRLQNALRPMRGSRGAGGSAQGLSYRDDLLISYEQHLPAWVFIESVTFGTFIEFYDFCGKAWGIPELSKAKPLLLSIKSLRNAAAHSNCIICDFAPDKVSPYPTQRAVSNALARGPFSQQSRARKMRNLRIQQLVTLFYAHGQFVHGKTSHANAVRLGLTLFERMFEHRDYYENNDVIRSSFEFVEKAFRHLLVADDDEA